MLRDSGLSRTRTLVGPPTVAAGVAIMREQERRDLWPYKHVFPPPNWKRRDPMASIASPVVATPTLILEFDVPSGYNFIMTALLLGAFGMNQIPVGQPGDFTLSVDKNTPVGGGVLQGSPLADWNAIPFNLGSLLFGPMILSSPEVFAPEDEIRAKVTNNALGVGAPNFFCAMFEGWLIPVEK